MEVMWDTSRSLSEGNGRIYREKDGRAACSRHDCTLLALYCVSVSSERDKGDIPRLYMTMIGFAQFLQRAMIRWKNFEMPDIPEFILAIYL